MATPAAAQYAASACCTSGGQFVAIAAENTPGACAETSASF